MSHVKPSLSIFEKLALAVNLTLAGLKALSSVVIKVLRYGDYSQRTRRRTLVTHLFRGFTSLPFRQFRFMLPPTGLTISAFCTHLKLPLSSVHLTSSTSSPFPPGVLHLITLSPSPSQTSSDNEPPITSTNTLLYFHGGGYLSPLTINNLKLALRFARAASTTNIAILEYTLAPELVYPGQLSQAASALSYLLRSRPASQIIVGGDSAGGNLTLALLAHLQTPHPDIAAVEFSGEADSKDAKTRMLRGAFCVSPRCANSCTSRSWTTNGDGWNGKGRDIITVGLMEKFTENWRPVAGEVWGTPVCGDERFWRNIPGNIVQRVLLVAGEDEVYLDDIRELAELMGADEDEGGLAKRNAKVEFTVCKGEVHAQCVIDAGLGIDDGIMFRRVLDWLQGL